MCDRRQSDNSADGSRSPSPRGVPIELSPLSPIPAPPGHGFVGACWLNFPDEDRVPARIGLAEDGLAGFVDSDGSRGAGAWVVSGPGRGVLAVSIRAAEALAGEAGITVQQGPIALGPGDDAATLTYSTKVADELGIRAEPDGPFGAAMQGADEAEGHPTPTASSRWRKYRADNDRRSAIFWNRILTPPRGESGMSVPGMRRTDQRHAA
jgi:hypothetical protein